jgi:DNA repair protein RecN (Recombination protein N)
VLHELRVENLGIIAEITVRFGSRMTAITGETGAGKTLLVEALELLLGGRADGSLVRDGFDEARVDGRFEHSGEELVLSRVLPRSGRSRAYHDGRPVTAGELAILGSTLVDLHGQHEQQSLLAPAAQRDLLDQWCGADALTARAALREIRAEIARLDGELAGLGGDDRARAREIGLLRFQVDEIAAAAILDEDEDLRLTDEEGLLGDAEAHRTALAAAHAALETSILEVLGQATALLAGRPPLHELHDRARAAQADLTELARDLRHAAETVVADPERLEAVRVRRQQLADLRRKYGDTLAEVVAFGESAAVRLAALDSYAARAAAIGEQRAALAADQLRVAGRLSHIRVAGAPTLGRAVSERLQSLAMPDAVFGVRVEPARGDPGEDGDLREAGADQVTFELAPNRGEPPRPLARAASGGELSRTMLAIRVVLGERAAEAPATLVFDEVDAGVGGEAGTALGGALAALAHGHQVLCVTHLAQVAAQADAQIHVRKHTERGRTIASAELLLDEARVAEISRMLGGVGDSHHARSHAVELLTRGTARAEPVARPSRARVRG